MATVQLLVSSGMPSPSVALSAADKNHLLGRVCGLTETVPGPRPTTLDYGGVLVECDYGDPISGFLAFDGVIAVYEEPGRSPRYVRDAESAVEHFLRKRMNRP